MRRWRKGLWFSLFDQIVLSGSSLSHFVAGSIIYDSLSLSFLPFQIFLKLSPFYVFFLFPTIFRSSFKLPSQYASPTLFLSSFLTFLLLFVVIPPKKFSQTPVHARITLPRSSPPWYMCGRDVRVVGSYRRRRKHFVPSLVPTVPSFPRYFHSLFNRNKPELFSTTKS